MYDQSLEQLIDAVIADGVITDQERKVVLKKAASLGIDQDEIEVYLEGKLDALTKANTPKSTKHGTVRTCPNCGASVGAFVGKCPECGHEFSGVSGNTNVRELMDRLDNVDKNKREKKGGFFSSDNPEREAEEKKAEIISLFPVPNTKNDLIEFATLCKTGLTTYRETSDIYDAWKGKASQIVDKANALFPNDSEVQAVVKSLKKEQNNFFKKHSELLAVTSLILFIVACGLLIYFLTTEKQRYTDSVIEQIAQLPTPNAENYLDCYRQFSNIVWTKDKHGDWHDYFSTFTQAQNDYKALLISAFKAAGVAEGDIPQNLKNKGADNQRDNISDTQNEDNPVTEIEEIPEAEIDEVEIDEVDIENI